MKCPNCGKVLTCEDYETYYDPEIEDTTYHILCSSCGYDESATETEPEEFDTAKFFNENAVCPCDIPDFEGQYHCPYDANGADACRHYCGLGVDE